MSTLVSNQLLFKANLNGNKFLINLNIIMQILLGAYGGVLANLAAIVDLELKKREATTTSARWVARALITCKPISSLVI